MFAQAELGRAVVALLALVPVQAPPGADGAPGWHLREGPGRAARLFLAAAEVELAPGARLEAGVDRTDFAADTPEEVPGVAARVALAVRGGRAGVDVELRAGLGRPPEGAWVLEAGLGAALRF